MDQILHCKSGAEPPIIVAMICIPDGLQIESTLIVMQGGVSGKIHPPNFESALESGGDQTVAGNPAATRSYVTSGDVTCAKLSLLYHSWRLLAPRHVMV